MDKNSFLSLQVERPITLGINLGALKSVMINVKTKTAQILYLKSDGETLSIKCDTDGKSVLYELKLMDIQEEQLNIPDMDFQYVVHLPSSEFVRTCLTGFGDTMFIQIGSDIKFVSKGSDGSSSVSYADVVMKSSGELTLEFASRYLALFTKGASLSKNVVLYLSPDMPIRIEFSFGGGHMSYYLAPKIEE